MKNLTTEEIKQAKRIAYKVAYDRYNVILNRSKTPRLDMRYRVSKLAISFWKNIDKTDFKLNEIKAKIKTRTKEANRKTINFLENPLIKDWINNKSEIKYINGRQLVFTDGRNHHAKNEKDIKIIAILKKHR